MLFNYVSDALFHTDAAKPQAEQLEQGKSSASRSRETVVAAAAAAAAPRPAPIFLAA